MWQEAYVEYLKSIALISQALQDEALTGSPPPAPAGPPPPHKGDAEVGEGASLQPPRLCAAGGEGLGPDTPKMLKLAEQCLERVKSLAAALGEPGGPGGGQRGGGGGG